MKSIQDALDSWDYAITDEDFSRLISSFTPCLGSNEETMRGQHPCSHPEGRTVEDFLRFDISTIGDACQFFQSFNPLFNRLRVFCLTAVNCENPLDSFEEWLTFDIRTLGFEEHSLIQRAGKSFQEVFEEKIKASYSHDLPAVKAALNYCLSLDGVLALPVSPEGDETFSYVRFSYGYSRKVLSAALNTLYGQVAKDVFLVPTHFIETASIAELAKESPSNFWHNGWLSKAVQTARARNLKDHHVQIEMLGRFPLRETFLASETDDASMHEALDVFARTMTLADAVKTARVI